MLNRWVTCILFGLFVAACDSDPPEGKMECTDAATDCPPEWICHIDGLCYSDLSAATGEKAKPDTQTTLPVSSDSDPRDAGTNNADDNETGGNISDRPVRGPTTL